MSCTFDKEKLTAFYDGELDAGERADVERHISACSECLRELGEIKSASVLVKTLSRPRAPQAVAAGVAQEIASRDRRVRLDKARRAALWVTAAAAGLFVVANVLWFAAPERSPRSEDATPALAAVDDERRKAAEPPPAPEGPAKLRAEAREAPLAPKKAVEKQADEALARGLAEEKSEFAKDKAQSTGAPAAKAESPAAKPEPAPAPRPAAAADGKASPARPTAPAVAAPAAPAPGAGADDRAAARLKESEAPTAYLCEAAGRPLVQARAAVEAFARRNQESERRRDVASGGARAASPSFGQAAPSPPLTVDLTDAEIAELSKELEQQGLKLVPASPEQEKQFNAQGAKTLQAPEQDALRKGGTAEGGAAAPAEAASRRAGTRRVTIYFKAPAAPK